MYGIFPFFISHRVPGQWAMGINDNTVYIVLISVSVILTVPKMKNILYLMSLDVKYALNHQLPILFTVCLMMCV
jgi:hypothetical protein